MTPINDYNVLRWFDAGAWSEAYQPLYTYGVPCVTGDIIHFFVNQDPLASVPVDPAQMKIKILDTCLVELADDVGTIQTITDSQGLQNYYGSINIPDIPDQVIYFVWYRDDNQQSMYVSNPFKVVTKQNYTRWTQVLTYRSDCNMLKYNYLDLPADWVNQFRIDLHIIGTSFPRETRVYREVPTGQRRTEYSQLDEHAQVLFYYMDTPTHRAINAALAHEEVKFNTVQFYLDGSYENETDDRGGLTIGTANLINKSNSNFINYLT